MMGIVKRVLTGFVVAVVMAGAAVAGPFEDGLAACQRGDYATALKLFRPLAEQGYAVGPVPNSRLHCTHFGPGRVAQDYAEAAKWYRLLPSRACRRPAYLGIMYERARRAAGLRQGGEVVPARRRAGQCHRPVDLGIMYANGHGVPQDYVLAHMWFLIPCGRAGHTRKQPRTVTHVDHDDARPDRRGAAAGAGVEAEDTALIRQDGGLSCRLGLTDLRIIALAQGPLRWFRDWPDASIPALALASTQSGTKKGGLFTLACPEHGMRVGIANPNRPRAS